MFFNSPQILVENQRYTNAGKVRKREGTYYGDDEHHVLSSTSALR